MNKENVCKYIPPRDYVDTPFELILSSWSIILLLYRELGILTPMRDLVINEIFNLKLITAMDLSNTFWKQIRVPR